MRIVANTNSLLTPLTGIGQYTYHLLSALREVDRENDYTYYYGFFSKELTAAVSSGNPSDPQSPDHYKIRTFQNLKRVLKQVPVIGPLGRELRTFYSKTVQRMRAPRFDLYFEPNFIPLSEIKTGKTVTMIFDLSVLLYPQWHPQERIRNFDRHFRKGLEKSDILLTATQHVKNQIVENLRVPPEKIYVTPISCNALFQNADSFPSQNHLNLPSHFLLFVGSIEPRKNILGFLKAYQQLPKSIREDVGIVFCGPGGWKNKDVFDLIEQNGLKNKIVSLPYVTDEQLLTLYKKATALVYPSFYEGFGLPPVEAMSSGCPVIASDIPTHREICRDGVAYVNPNDSEQMASTIQSVIEDNALRDALKEKGLKHSKNFSWTKTAQETLKIFQICYRS